MEPMPTSPDVPPMYGPPYMMPPRPARLTRFVPFLLGLLLLAALLCLHASIFVGVTLSTDSTAAARQVLAIAFFVLMDVVVSFLFIFAFFFAMRPDTTEATRRGVFLITSVLLLGWLIAMSGVLFSFIRFFP